MERKYRPCVLAVFTNAQGKVLVGERVHPGRSWQFPQGGIDPGETPEEAVAREMREELGVPSVVIVKRSHQAIRYDFPADFAIPLAKTFAGQDQIWFHLHLPPGVKPDLAKAADKEFQALEWITPAEALYRIVPFKRAAYERGLAELGLYRDDDDAAARSKDEG